MRVYETTIIIHPDLAEEQVNEAISRTEAEIEKGGGKIIEVNLWGIRKLAYRIKRQQRGNYVIFKYAAPPNLVRAVEYQLRVMESIIRFMTVNLEQEIDERDLVSIQKVLKKPEPVTEPEVEESMVEEEEFGEYEQVPGTRPSSEGEADKEIEDGKPTINNEGESFEKKDKDKDKGVDEEEDEK